MGAGRGLFVILMPTLECNLACAYCFEDHVRGRWDLDTTRRVIDEVVELARRERVERLTVHWQGGEVLLMGADYFARACATLKERATKAGIASDQRMQTNLVRYSSEWAPIVHEHFDGGLGTSFEPGPARQHPNGDGRRFQREWKDAFERACADGVRVGVLSLASREALEEGAASYLERLRDRFGIRRLRIGLPFRQATGSTRGYWLDAEATGRFLVDAYRFWVDHGRDEHVHLRPFRLLEDLLARGDSREPGLCIFAANCVDVSLAVAPDGTVTLCDSFVSSDVLPPFGNVFAAPLWQIHGGAARAAAHRRAAAQIQPKCASCRYISLCYGGCLVRSHLRTDGEYHYCRTYQMLYSAIEERISPGMAARFSLPVIS